jgi:hypothetical protein
MRATELVPGHGLGGVELSGAAGDPVQGRELRPARGGGEPIQIGGDRVFEVRQTSVWVEFRGRQIDGLDSCRRLRCNCTLRRRPGCRCSRQPSSRP